MGNNGLIEPNPASAQHAVSADRSNAQLQPQLPTKALL